jgi:hypothetical protein
MDLRNDSGFMAAPRTERHQYLMAKDRGYAGASPADQQAYLDTFEAPQKPIPEFRADRRDLVGRIKDQLSAEPVEPRPDILGVGGPDLGPYVRQVGRWILPESNGGALRDLAMTAVPVSRVAGAAGKVLLPAAERTAYATAQPMLEHGDTARGVQQGISVASLEALMSALRAGPAFKRYLETWRPQPPPTPPAAVHQAANFAQPTTIYGPQGQVASQVTPPITFQRTPGGTPTVSGGGPTSVTPTTVTVQPPSSGTPITGGPSPAAILQEHMPRPAAPPPARSPIDPTAAVDIAGAENPEAGTCAGIGGLAALSHLIPFLHRGGAAAPITEAVKP